MSNKYARSPQAQYREFRRYKQILNEFKECRELIRAVSEFLHPDRKDASFCGTAKGD